MQKGKAVEIKGGILDLEVNGIQQKKRRKEKKRVMLTAGPVSHYEGNEAECEPSSLGFGERCNRCICPCVLKVVKSTVRCSNINFT